MKTRTREDTAKFAYLRVPVHADGTTDSTRGPKITVLMSVPQQAQTSITLKWLHVSSPHPLTRASTDPALAQAPRTLTRWPAVPMRGGGGYEKGEERDGGKRRRRQLESPCPRPAPLAYAPSEPPSSLPVRGRGCA